MNTIAEKVIALLATLPDKAFTGKWDYHTQKQIADFIDERRRVAMLPIDERRGIAQEKAWERQKERKAQILAWHKSKRLLLPGMRVKFGNTRDRGGYRKIHSIDGEQIIGFQFRYDRPWQTRLGVKHIVLHDQSTTTSNHVTHLQQVLLVSGKWVKIRDIIEHGIAL